MRTFHAHVYIDPSDHSRSRSLRERIIQHSQFSSARVGKFHETPVGPHMAGQFQIAFSEEIFMELVNFLMMNAHGLSVLIHPESGNDLLDHTAHALWIGEKLPLDTSRL